MKYKGIIFDMDGTLTLPSIDFASVRRDLGIESGDILEAIATWSKDNQAKAWNLIEKYEEDVRDNIILQFGCRKTLLKFQKSAIKLGILTRNSQKSVNAFLDVINFSFDNILTREHTSIKPSPQPVYDILAEWSVAPEHVLLVGDFIHDIECGKAAGADTCFFFNSGATSYAEFADFTVGSYRQLEKIVLI